MADAAATATTQHVRVFGIRHHGPGSARSLVQALSDFDPGIVLIEGPPDAGDIIPLAADPAMQPPVALLIYDGDHPSHAAFYPFAVFSPEWQAIQWALSNARPVRFIDLPMSQRPQAPTPESDAAPASPGAGPGESAAEATGNPEEEGTRSDPIGELARAAGFGDREKWWEHVIEQRQDPTAVFEGVLEAMRGFRDNPASIPRDEALREAHMRRCIRQAKKEGHGRIAVICGAWHAPALDDMPPARADDALLKGLPKSRHSAAWIPWTHSRLGYRSGYGAGVDSPGWYAHLWARHPRVSERWIAQAARLLRGNGLDAPVAGVIEAVRLAEALASLRDLPAPGLAELREAILTVLCHGESVLTAVIREQLEVGTDLGTVPESAPQVPLARDIASLQKTLRLKPTADQKVLDLDLRKDYDRERSRLFHRLALLDIDWAKESQSSQSNRGTFRESWQLEWKPELVINIVEAAIYGNTVATAATNRASAVAAHSTDIGELARLLDKALLAELPEASDAVLTSLQSRGAVTDDVAGLLATLPPLARAAKYGTVRAVPTEPITHLFASLLERAIAGLPLAAVRLNPDAARELRPLVLAADEAVALTGVGQLTETWRNALRELVAKSNASPLLRGTSLLLLVRSSTATPEEVQAALSRELSPGEPHEYAASWLEGFVDQSAATLIHRTDVLPWIDQWLLGIPEESFVESLPILRRAFSSFDTGEKAALSRRVTGLPAVAAAGSAGSIEASTPADQAQQVSKTNQTTSPTPRPEILAAMGRLMGVNFQ